MWCLRVQPQGWFCTAQSRWKCVFYCSIQRSRPRCVRRSSSCASTAWLATKRTAAARCQPCQDTEVFILCVCMCAEYSSSAAGFLFLLSGCCCSIFLLSEIRNQDCPRQICTSQMVPSPSWVILFQRERASQAWLVEKERCSMLRWRSIVFELFYRAVVFYSRRAALSLLSDPRWQEVHIFYLLPMKKHGPWRIGREAQCHEKKK